MRRLNIFLHIYHYQLYSFQIQSCACSIVIDTVFPCLEEDTKFNFHAKLLI